MKKAICAVLSGLLGLTLAVAALAAEKFEDKAAGLRVTAPEGFTTAAQLPSIPDEIGKPKVLFTDKNYENNGGQLLIHLMDLPGGAEYAAFKTDLVATLKDYFGDGFKLHKQEDVAVGKQVGFSIEFEGPGNGKMPEPGGTIPHHIRWVLVRDGNERLMGFVYHCRESAWKELEPKFSASQKTLASAE